MKEKKGIKISIILTLIGVVSLVTGITFAIYENTINAGKSQVIKTGVVNFILTESTNERLVSANKAGTGLFPNMGLLSI